MYATLSDYIQAAQDADEADAFATRFAPLFFTCADPDSLSPQTRPQATAQLSAEMLQAVLEGGDLSGTMMVLPIRRSSDSAFRFISVGRTSNCDVAINDGSISKLHAIVREREDGVLTIEDAGSANGTFVDDEAAYKRGDGDPTPLRDGAAVCLGRVNFEVWSAKRVWEKARLLGAEQPAIKTPASESLPDALELSAQAEDDG